jgi:hypothetical protein
MIAPNRVSVLEMAKSLTLRSKDKLGVGLADYVEFGKDIFHELNMKGIKDAKRVVLKVNKKINSIELPGETLQVASLYRIDECGTIVPFWSNPKISEDVIDLSADKQCDCGCDLCATIKNYEAIETTVTMDMPDSTTQSFTKTVTKIVKADGSWIRKITEPVMKYDNEGVHTATVMETTEEEICKFDVDKNGCVKDTEENQGKAYTNCGFVDLKHECGCPTRAIECPNNNDLKIDETGRRIILPTGHSYDHVIARIYYDLKTKDIMVPQVCKKVFMQKMFLAGIEFDNSVSTTRRMEVQRNIAGEESSMLSNLSRMTVSEFYKTALPKRPM